MQFPGDYSVSFRFPFLVRAPLYLERLPLVDDDSELRGAEHRARVRLQRAAADRDPAMGDPLGIG